MRPPSFCKRVSSSLRNLSSSWRRSLSSLRQTTSSRKIEIDCGFTDKNNTFETQISEAKPRPQTKTFCSCVLILWDPGTVGIHPPSANMSPLPCGTSPPLRGGASPPWRKRLQVHRDLVTQSTPQTGKTWTPNEDFWSCFLILWDPGNQPPFCKQVSSSLRNLSSSSRRSLSSLRQTTSSRKIEIDFRFTDKNNTFETQISEAKPRPQTKTFCSCFLILWDPGTLGIHPPSANMSPLPCGTSPPLRGGASPPWRKRLQVHRDLVAQSTPQNMDPK